MRRLAHRPPDGCVCVFFYVLAQFFFLQFTLLIETRTACPCFATGLGQLFCFHYCTGSSSSRSVGGMNMYK